MTIEALKKQAEELGIEVNDDVTEEELTSLINSKTSDDKEYTVEELIAKVKYLEEDQKKAHKSRDTAKAERRKAEQQIEELKKQSLNEKHDKKELDALAQKLKEYQEAEAERQEKEDEARLKKMDEADRIKATYEKQLKTFQDEMNSKIEQAYGLAKDKENEIKEKEKVITNLTRKTLESDISSNAAILNAVNPKQIVKLLKDDFEWSETLGVFEYVVRDNNGRVKSTMSISEAVKDFLEDDSNSHLVKATVKPPLEAKHTQTTSTKSPSTKNYGKYDPKDPDLIFEAEEKGLPIEIHIKNCITRDKKRGVYKEDTA